MKSIAIPAGVVIYVALVIAVALQVRDPQPGLRILTVQTIAIDPGAELERDMQ